MVDTQGVPPSRSVSASRATPIRMISQLMPRPDGVRQKPTSRPQVFSPVRSPARAPAGGAWHPRPRPCPARRRRPIGGPWSPPRRRCRHPRRTRDLGPPATAACAAVTARAEASRVGNQDSSVRMPSMSSRAGLLLRADRANCLLMSANEHCPLPFRWSLKRSGAASGPAGRFGRRPAAAVAAGSAFRLSKPTNNCLAPSNKLLGRFHPK